MIGCLVIRMIWMLVICLIWIFIQTWADAFGRADELKEVGRAVQELKDKGVEFPMTDLDTFAPIYTPAMV